MNSRVNKKKNNTGLLIALSGTILFHGLLAAGLIYSALSHTNHITLDEGDNSIKAIMIDMSMVAAPELSLVEDSIAAPDIKETVNEEPETIEPIEDIVEEPEEVIVEVETIIPPVKPIIQEEPKPKPKPPVKQQQQPSTPRVRQDVDVANRSDIATASQSSENTNYSATPKPVNRRNPVYPRRALDLRIEGRVVVLYDIDERGKVVNIRIVEAKPRNIFNRSIMTAMQQWRYEKKPAKDLSITIIFENGRSTSL